MNTALGGETRQELPNKLARSGLYGVWQASYLEEITKHTTHGPISTNTA